MADFNKIVPLLFHWEGGYDANPNDKGNWSDGQLIGTKYGVSAQLLREIRGRTLTIDDMKNLTESEALKIMKSKFWDKHNADDIHNQSVANFIIDWCYNSGAGTAIKKVQEIVGAKADGQAGPETVRLINSWDAETLFNKLKQSRIDFVNSIDEKRKAVYLKGWLNRINSFSYEP